MEPGLLSGDGTPGEPTGDPQNEPAVTELKPAMLPACGKIRTADNGVNGVLALLPPGYIGVEADVMDLTEAWPSEGNLPLTMVWCGRTALPGGSAGIGNSKGGVKPQCLWQRPAMLGCMNNCWRH